MKKFRKFGSFFRPSFSTYFLFYFYLKYNWTLITLQFVSEFDKNLFISWRQSGIIIVCSTCPSVHTRTQRGSCSWSLTAVRQTSCSFTVKPSKWNSSRLAIYFNRFVMYKVHSLDRIKIIMNNFSHSSCSTWLWVGAFKRI